MSYDEAYIAKLFADSRVVECRMLGDGPPIVGTFSRSEALAAALRLSRGTAVKGIYTTLNAPNMGLVPTERFIRGRNAPAAMKDADIATITRMPFDFDPVRAEGFKKSSTTADELEESEIRARWLQAWLTGKGWPDPLVAMSGNGYHLQYRLCMPSSPETASLMDDIYLGLNLRCSTAEVKFDRTVRNASRIFRLYGTTARKGEPTEDRPHRQSWCQIPDPWDIVPLELIEELAAEVKPAVAREERIAGPEAARASAVTGDGDYTTLDVVAWFRSRGLYKRALVNGKHAVICPWLDEHSNEDTLTATDTVVWEAQGKVWPTFRCLHAHCDKRTITDVMRELGDADRFCRRKYDRR